MAWTRLKQKGDRALKVAAPHSWNCLPPLNQGSIVVIHLLICISKDIVFGMDGRDMRHVRPELLILYVLVAFNA